MKKTWYAVYTKINNERKVVALLSKKKIENYCPNNRIVLPLQGNKRKLEFEPLFSCFVFVCITEAEIEIVKKISFVIDFVYWLGAPAVIKDIEIENMKQFTQQHFNITIEKTNVNVSGNVRMLNDPTYNNDSLVSILNSTIRLQLPSLGFIMVAEISKENADAIAYNFEREKLVV